MNRTVKFMAIGAGALVVYNALKYWHAASEPTTVGGAPPTNAPSFYASLVTTFNTNGILPIAIGAGGGFVASKVF